MAQDQDAGAADHQQHDRGQGVAGRSVLLGWCGDGGHVPVDLVGFLCSCPRKRASGVFLKPGSPLGAGTGGIGVGEKSHFRVVRILISSLRPAAISGCFNCHSTVTYLNGTFCLR
jgi:hypothetical protein